MPYKNSSDGFIVALLGGRQHYAVPRAFHLRSYLAAFVTDYWVSAPVSAWLRHLPWKASARLAGRSHPDLPDRLVHTLPALMRLHATRKIGWNRELLYDFYCREGRLFASGVNAFCRRRFSEGLAKKVYFGFTSTSLETLQFFTENDGVTIVDQIDPLCTEHHIIQQEREKWPGWEYDKLTPSSDYIARVKEEWRLATYVLVNSEWTAKALAEQAVERNKIMIVPQAYEGPVGKSESRNSYHGQRPLRVLWLGSVILRKGIQYLLKAAQVLGRAIQVRVIGPIGIAQDKVAAASGNVSFLGQVPRVHCEQHWQWADVFVLPTLSDGFALTQLEAMARGLPVVVTPNCGKVVRHGINGFIVESGSTDALVQAISILISDPEWLEYMSERALESIQQFTLDRYVERVLAGLGWTSNGLEEGVS